MGIKRFFNNLRYLTRYNIKDINRNINDCINTNDLLNLLHILPYVKTNYNKGINIKDIEETIDTLINSNSSLIRYGDGEFNIIKGQDIPFQKYNKKLGLKLREIINDKNILVAIPYFYFNIELNKYNKSIYLFIIEYVVKEIDFISNLLVKENIYLSTEFTQLYQIYQYYDFDDYFQKIRQIWENKEIVIVCGETVFKHIKYNIFDNSKTIEYIYAPSKNAFDKYDDILNQSLEYSKDKLFIAILGPTAKVLVYDLAKQGYRALDLGHIAKDYDAFMKKIDRNHENIVAFFKPD